MSETVKATESGKAAVAKNATDAPGGSPQTPRVITDPREVAAVVMVQLHVVNTKKEELLAAIKGLTDMTQQLVVAYAGQARFIERLATNRGTPPDEKPDGTGGHNQSGDVLANRASQGDPGILGGPGIARPD